MRSSDAQGVALEIERQHDVAAWRIDGVCVWPIVRIWLYNEVMNRGLTQGPPLSGSRKLWSLAQRAVRARWRVWVASWQDRRSNARLGDPADVAFYSDGVNFVKVDGLWYDKLFDPIIGWLQTRGGRHLLLTPMAQAYHPRRSASRFVQPRLDAIKLLSTVRGTVRADVQLPGFEEAMAGHGMTRAHLLAMWGRLRAQSEYFLRILQLAGPKRAFVNTYYSIEGMAFVLACRRCGIRVADVQHGLQGDYHIAYGQWQRPPPSGYELLPDEFWVWSEQERRTIDAWRPPSGRIHVPVIAGNAWLELWRTGSDPFVARALSQAQSLRSAGARHCVLVTLQWGLHEQETLRLLAAARRAPADFQWWFRLHPLVSHERRPVYALIERSGVRGVEVDGPTDLPLHALLRVADLHVTHSSSTVIEAAEFGLRSVVCSDYGAQFFAAQVAAGEAVVAKSEEEIAQAVLSLAAAGRREVASRADGGSLEAVLVREFPQLAGSSPRV